ncbi:hypothetical protein N7478_002358 [Penicillium angulare]|uniref:uncharacterized protein n=1 Tax=Penicillium angulare TaxID=116970 RepID=UPI002541F753|nr:uncharacterized protein N7478_002358 [Penicillium angulare]KAJ5286672.1 hypothetical protein N7478_002358 [Penicillium angulare]
MSTGSESQKKLLPLEDDTSVNICDIGIAFPTVLHVVRKTNLSDEALKAQIQMTCDVALANVMDLDGFMRITMRGSLLKKELQQVLRADL